LADFRFAADRRDGQYAQHSTSATKIGETRDPVVFPQGPVAGLPEIAPALAPPTPVISALDAFT